MRDANDRKLKDRLELLCAIIIFATDQYNSFKFPWSELTCWFFAVCQTGMNTNSHYWNPRRAAKGFQRTLFRCTEEMGLNQVLSDRCTPYLASYIIFGANDECGTGEFCSYNNGF